MLLETGKFHPDSKKLLIRGSFRDPATGFVIDRRVDQMREEGVSSNSPSSNPDSDRIAGGFDVYQHVLEAQFFLEMIDHPMSYLMGILQRQISIDLHM